MKRAIRLDDPEALIESTPGRVMSSGEEFKTPPPTEHELLFVDRPSELSRLGIWRSEPYEARYEDYPFDELMVILSGRLTLVYDDGTEDHFGPSDALILPKGFSGIWRQPEVVLKYFATV